MTVCRGGTATAALSSGSQVNAAVPISPDPSSGQTVTAGTPFSNGQTISIQVPANSALTPNAAVKIIECMDPGGLVANLPTSAGSCDTTTVSATSIIPKSDGSFTYNGYQVFSLPGPLFNPSPATCDLTHACVLWIGDNYNSLNVNQLWSQPFYITPNADSLGENPGDGSAPSTATTPSPTLSTVAASPSTAAANGTNSWTVTVTINGLNGQSASVPIAGAPVSLSQGSGHSTITPSSATTNSSGVASFTVMDSVSEPVTFTATSGSVTITNTASVTFQAPTVSGANSMISASPPSVPADGSSTSTITVTVRDQALSPQALKGVTVSLTQGSSNSTISPSTNNTDTSGVATFTVKDSTVEPVKYTATAGGVTLTATATVTFGTLTVSPSASTVTAASSAADTGTNGGTTITVTLLTAGHQAVAARNVTLSGTGSGPPAITPTSPVMTGPNGTAIFTVTDSVAETVTFSAQDVTDGVSLTPVAIVTFSVPPPPSPSATLSTVTVSPTTLAADGTATANFFVSIRDSADHVLPNKIVSVTPTTPDVKVEITALVPSGGTQGGETDSNGVASFQALNTLAETVSFTVTDKTDNITLVTPHPLSVTFTAGPADGSQSSVVANPTATAADGSASSIVSVTLNDHFGNPVVGKTISLDQGGGHSLVNPPTAVTDGS